MNEPVCGRQLCPFVSYVLSLVSPRSVSNRLTGKMQIALMVLQIGRVAPPLLKQNFYRANSKLFEFRLQIKFNRKNIVACLLNVINQQLDYSYYFFCHFYNHIDPSPPLFARWCFTQISTRTPSLPVCLHWRDFNAKRCRSRRFIFDIEIGSILIF